MAVGRQVVPVIDRALALSLAGVLGFDARVVALLLPVVEAGMWGAVGQSATPGVDEDSSC
jgi:hypothetical protein